MGQLVRENRSQRFIEEFSQELCAEYITEQLFRLDSVSLGTRSSDSGVCVFLAMKNVETGELLELCDETVFFDPEEDSACSMVDNLLLMKPTWKREEIVKRLKKADLIPADYDDSEYDGEVRDG